MQNYELKSKKNSRNNRKKAMTMRFWKNCLLIVLSIALIRLWLKTKSFVFDERDIVENGRKFAGQDVEKAFQKITRSLDLQYPGHILPEQKQERLMYKFSGMTLSLTILHSSLTEYIVLTGTALDTNGYIGRHWTNVTLVVLSGSIKYWEEGRLRAIEYKPGDSFTHYSGTTGSLSWGANTWVLEYGRGFVPMSFPSTLADMTFTSFDVIGIFKMCRGFAVAMYYELKNEIVSFISSI